MGELLADLELGLHLLDEADVLRVGADDVLEREDLARVRIADGVDGAARTFSQPLQDIIVEEFSPCNRLSLTTDVRRPGPKLKLG